MNFISERVNNLSASATIAMSQKSAELRAAGIDVINMSIGEPDFNTPEHIKEAAKAAIDANFTHYPPVAGYLSLRKAICDKLKRENGLDYSPEEIVVGNGAKQELCNALLATVNPGDEVIIPVPAWVSYVEMVKLAEGKPVLVYAGVEQDFKITPQQLEAAITPDTRLLMFNSPSNPTGSVYTGKELKALAEVLERHPQVIVLADDIYEHINYTGGAESISRFASLRDRMIVVNGVSKAYAMTGWRIGYLAAPLPIAKACANFRVNTHRECHRLHRKPPKLPMPVHRIVWRICARRSRAVATLYTHLQRISPDGLSTDPRGRSIFPRGVGIYRQEIWG